MTSTQFILGSAPPIKREAGEEQVLLGKRMALFYGRMPMIVAGTIVAALVIWSASADGNPLARDGLVWHCWLAAVLLHMGYRLWMSYRFARDMPAPEAARYHQRRSATSVILHGLLFSLGGMMSLLPGPGDGLRDGEHIIILLALLGLAFGSAITASFDRRLLVVYPVLLLSPVLATLLANGGSEPLVVAGCMASIIGATVSLATRHHDTLEETMRLQLRHERTARALAASQVAHHGFFAAANHDIRQPLQSLLLWVDALQKPGGGATAAVVRGVAESAAAMARLVDRLMAVSCLEAGAVRNQPAWCDLETMVRAVAARHEVAARARGLDLVTRCPAGTRVFMDAAILERVIENLVTNAINHTARGQVGIRVLRKRETVAIAVTDSGAGIEPEAIEHIFDDFYSTGRASVASARHYGMGLASVRRLAALAGMQVAVESTLGAGSCFSIEFAAPIGDAATPPVPAAAPEDAGRVRARRAILIEDDPLVLQGMQASLEALGCTVDACDGYAALLQLIERIGHVPDLLITDHELEPPFTSRDAIAVARREYDAGLPCIVVTGNPYVLESFGDLAGVVACLKPVRPAQLRAAMQRASGAT